MIGPATVKARPPARRTIAKQAPYRVSHHRAALKGRMLTLYKEV